MIEREHFSRKSDPPIQKLRKQKHSLIDADSTAVTKRRGTSLARDFSHQNSYRTSSKYVVQESTLKRISAWDPNSRQGDYSNSGSTGKILSFLKSGLSLNKTKSKSKLTLDESHKLRRSLKSAKSEENLFDYHYYSKNQRRYSWSQNFGNGSGFDIGGVSSEINPPIDVSKLRNMNLNQPGDTTLYQETLSNKHEPICRKLIELDDRCWVEPLDESLVNGLKYCIRITKPLFDSPARKAITPLEYPPSSSSNISKSFSFTSASTDRSNSMNYRSNQQTNASMVAREPDIDQEGTYQIVDLSCFSVTQRNDWIRRLKQIISPQYEDKIRSINQLNIWIQEAKNVPAKKRYYCEICLNNRVYARTSQKQMGDSVFWGEEFELMGLQSSESVQIYLYRCHEQKKKRDKIELVAQFTIPTIDLIHPVPIEKWHTPSNESFVFSSNNNNRSSTLTKNRDDSIGPYTTNKRPSILNDNSTTIRIKARYQSIRILPTTCYEPLLIVIRQSAVDLVQSMESMLKVKSKEDLISSILMVLMSDSSGPKACRDFLSKLITSEVSNCLATEEDGSTMMLRGNTMASKAIEVYLKHIGNKYLHLILNDLVIQISNNPANFEVDPSRLTGSNKEISSNLERNQEKLLKVVEEVWKKICANADKIPSDLKSVLIKIRHNLLQLNYNFSTDNNNSIFISDTVIDNVISSCLFLRLICPAIMSPFLFGLMREYSENLQVHRAFTLVAKTIQSLANISDEFERNYDHGSPTNLNSISRAKESYMQFMQPFFNSQKDSMRIFLREISSGSKSSTSNSNIKMSSSNSSNIPVSIMSTKRLVNATEPDPISSIDSGYFLANLSMKLEDCFLESTKNISVNDLNPLHRNIIQILDVISTCEEPKQKMSFNKPVRPFPSYLKQVYLPNKTNISNTSHIKSSFLSSPMSSCEVEENFSFIPTESSSYTNRKRSNTHANETDYVAFETMQSTTNVQKDNSSIINEINREWEALVKESNRTKYSDRSSRTKYVEPPPYSSLPQNNEHSRLQSLTSGTSIKSSVLEPDQSQQVCAGSASSVLSQSSGYNSLSKQAQDSNESDSFSNRIGRISNITPSNQIPVTHNTHHQSSVTGKSTPKRQPNIKRIIDSKRANNQTNTNPLSISKSFDETYTKNLTSLNKIKSPLPSSNKSNLVNNQTEINQLDVNQTTLTNNNIPPVPPKRSESRKSSNIIANTLLIDNRNISLSRSLNSLSKNIPNTKSINMNNNNNNNSSSVTSSSTSLSSSINSQDQFIQSLPQSNSVTPTRSSITSTTSNLINNKFQLQRSISIKSSISSNIDLDPLISNELKRFKMLMELFDIDKSKSISPVIASSTSSSPSLNGPRHSYQYQGSAVEQYKQRIIDEDILRDMIRLIQERQLFTRKSIERYIPSCYRLLKNIQSCEGKLCIDEIVQNIICVNKSIQEHIKSLFPTSPNNQRMKSSQNSINNTQPIITSNYDLISFDDATNIINNNNNNNNNKYDSNNSLIIAHDNLEQY